MTGLACPHCEVYVCGACPMHADKLPTIMHGHILLNHPEEAPDEIRAIARDPTALVRLRALGTDDPAYRLLLDALAKHVPSS